MNMLIPEPIAPETLRREMTIVIDTREKENGHILDYFEREEVPVIRRTLEFGDYSAVCGQYTLEQSFAVERKNSLTELASNLSYNPTRFEAELGGARCSGCALSLLIENSSVEDLFFPIPHCTVRPERLFGRLMTLQRRYGFQMNFCRAEYSGKLIRFLLYHRFLDELRHSFTEGELK